MNKLAKSSCLVAIALSVAFQSSWANAQAQTYPNQGYYNTFNAYYFGDYKDAYKNFSRGAGTAYRVGTNRFLDSICYWVMMGECEYQLGNYARAVEMYEQSLKLYLSFVAANWQGRTTFPDLINPDLNRPNKVQINWGSPQRKGTIANIPNSMTVVVGNIDPTAAQHGILLNTTQGKRVDVSEIMRCTALALHRRRTIKGVTCKYDPFSTTLVTELSKYGGGGGSLAGCWNGVLLGIAQAGVDDWNSATRTLTNSLQLSGGMDHSLTPVALLELAYASFVMGKPEAAAPLCLEASYSAALHFQSDLAEEALSLGTTIHLMKNRSPYPPLENAINWAARKKARMMQGSLTVRLAECLAEAGNGVASRKVLAETKKAMTRNSIGQSVINSRRLYVSAVLGYLGGESEGARAELQAALSKFTSAGSKWIYQLGLADNLVVSGNITPRQGDLLYRSLLRDPTAIEWQLDPIEAMSFLTTPHIAPLERWFEIKVGLKQFDEAIEIAELIRRHRFFSSLPMGGRLMAFRWMLHAPDEALTKEALTQRVDFLARNEPYKALTDRSKLIRTELMKLPIKPQYDSVEEKQQTDLFVELMKVSNTQEAMLSSYALRRQPAEMEFPPKKGFSEFRKTLKDDQLAFIALATANGYHKFLVSNTNQQYLGLSRARDIKSGVGKVLKQLGIKDATSGVDAKDLLDSEWTEAANGLYQTLFPEVADDGWDKFRELVVVPDGILWYMPFEILQFGPDVANLKPLGESVDVRYSPTLFLAYGPQRPQRSATRQAVVFSRMHPKGDLEHTQTMITQLEADMPQAVTFGDKMRIPSNLLGSILDSMTVMSDLKVAGRANPYALVPAQLDQGKNGSNLAGWLSLPLEGPEHLVLPGFTSGGAAGIRSTGNGSDMFLTSCALIASGARSIVISRWRVGGKNSMEFTNKYSQLLAAEGPRKSMNAANAHAKGLDIEVEFEPRMKTKKLDKPMKADHPFFWAQYMLIEVPDREPAPVAGGNVNANGNPNALPMNVAPNLPGAGGAAKPGAAVKPGDKQAVDDDSKSDKGQAKDDGKSDAKAETTKSSDDQSDKVKAKKDD